MVETGLQTPAWNHRAGFGASTINGAVSRRHSHGTRVQRVITYLYRNMAVPINLDELADVACCSPWHLERIFAEVTNLTPIAFLSAIRMEAARTRVMSSDSRIIDIAYDVGYNSLGSFGTRFTSVVGMAPRMLRRAADGFDLTHFIGLLETQSAGPRSAPPRHRPSLCGTLRMAPELPQQEGFALLALFPEGVPSIHPITCSVARVPGTFQLQRVPHGAYSLFSLGFPRGVTTQEALLQTQLPRTWRNALLLHGEPSVNVRELVLDPPSTGHPPIVPVFPILLEQRA